LAVWIKAVSFAPSFLKKTFSVMAEPKHYATIGEKFEDITKNKRQNNTMVWLTNPAMNALPAHNGNPVLIEISAKQYAHPKSPYMKQGYVKYVHAKPAPAPVEAKVAPSKPSQTN